MSQTGTPSSWSWRRRFKRLWWARAHSAWEALRWPLVVTLALAAVVLGSWGFDVYLTAQAVERSTVDKLYLSFQLFALESGNVVPPVPWQLDVARFLAPAVTVYAAVSAILLIFREQLTRLRVRLFARDHVLICGLGRMGLLLAHGFRELDRRVVVIEKDRDNSAVAEAREDGASTLLADATGRTMLRKARVDRATHLFAVCGDDGTNAAIAVEARSLVDGRQGSSLSCFVHLLDTDLVELLRAVEAQGGSAAFRLEIFNPSERGAPALLDEYPPFDRTGMTPLGPPRILVVGLGQMGSRLVVHAARRWKQTTGDDGRRFTVKVVDNKADEHVENLRQRDEVVERMCELIPSRMDIDEPAFERARFLFDEEGNEDVTGIYVCLGDDARGLAAALRLRRRLNGRVPIVVRAKHRGGLASLLDPRREGSLYADLSVFGLLDLVCQPKVLLGERNEDPAATAGGGAGNGVPASPLERASASPSRGEATDR